MTEWPHTNRRYRVRNRGTLDAGEDGRVVVVEATRRTISAKGVPLSREMMSTDVRKPLPDVTYGVDDYAQLHTNEFGQTDHVQIEDLELKSATLRSGTSQSKVAGGTQYDAGHLVARMFGGPREEINLVKMLPNANRGDIAEIERTLLRHIDAGDKVGLDVKVARYDSNSTGAVPHRFTFRATFTDADGHVETPYEEVVRQ